MTWSRSYAASGARSAKAPGNRRSLRLDLFRAERDDFAVAPHDDGLAEFLVALERRCHGAVNGLHNIFRRPELLRSGDSLFLFNAWLHVSSNQLVPEVIILHRKRIANITRRPERAVLFINTQESAANK